MNNLGISITTRKISNENKSIYCLQINKMKYQTEAVARRCSVKIDVLKNLAKDTLAQVFSCEFCQISKSSYFY